MLPGSLLPGALVLAVLNADEAQRRAVGEDEARRGQPPVARPQHGVQHGLVEQEVAHPLADQDVNLVHRQRHLLHLACISNRVQDGTFLD